MLLQIDTDMARLVVDFVKELADELTSEMPSFEFRGYYNPYSMIYEPSEAIPRLSGYFKIDVKGEGLADEFVRMDTRRRAYVRDWVPFSHFCLENAADAKPSRRSAHCILYFPRLVPGFFRDQVESFLDINFVCRNTVFVNQ